METVRRKKLIKINSVCRCYNAQLMRWMHLIIFTQVNNAGRTFLTFFKKDRLLDLMIINIEKTASQKYLV